MLVRRLMRDRPGLRSIISSSFAAKISGFRSAPFCNAAPMGGAMERRKQKPPDRSGSVFGRERITEPPARAAWDGRAGRKWASLLVHLHVRLALFRSAQGFDMSGLHRSVAASGLHPEADGCALPGKRRGCYVLGGIAGGFLSCLSAHLRCSRMMTWRSVSRER